MPLLQGQPASVKKYFFLLPSKENNVIKINWMVRETTSYIYWILTQRVVSNFEAYH